MEIEKSSTDLDMETNQPKDPKTKQQTQQYESPTKPSKPSGLDSTIECLLLFGGNALFFLLLPFTIWAAVKIALDYQRYVVFRLGKISGGARGPGPIFINPLIDEARNIDMRTVTFDVKPQEVLTRDSVTVAVDAVVYFRVYEPISCVVNIVDASHATKLLAQTTLRNLLGTLTLSDILSDRENISTQMQTQLDEATDYWGIKVERVEIKDVILPRELQRAMAAEAEAAREAKAKVIAAEGEFKASQSLQAAAEVISKSPGALHLRYLQTLNTISAEHNSTVVFPFPIELLKK
ncbi:hypothetical protein RRG08_060731 [Elysia crispata]|uniref:Band 7 domain-containing protein n=1 Tax=Elysia crispata TaxID=231223 RepID=A0AAE0ZJI0_9GAST|nr:hypothetical protein RRG08_060731 [Elysia crispata]